MNEALPQDEQRALPPDEGALRERLQLSREKLEALAGELRAVDRELEGFACERAQYRLLEQVCGALDELGALGGSTLFWDGVEGSGIGAEHLEGVRARVQAFRKRLDEIESRRQEVLEAIEGEQERADLVADDLDEVLREAELRKLEWIPDREVEAFALHASSMPWARGGEDDRRFRKTLAGMLLASLLLGLLLPQIDLPLPDPWEAAEVPERLTRLVTERRSLPPPPVQPETRPEEPEPTEELAATEETTPQAKSEPAPEPKPAAASKGILAFREKFSGLAESRAEAKLGARARVRDTGEPAAGRTTRSMVATRASGSSGGIDLAALSRDVGGGGGGGTPSVEIARVTSSIGGGGGGERPLAGGPGPGRTDEEIQIVFDRHKAALYRLYNRELRRDPTLQGQMVLRLRIEPDGSVSLCELSSSDMGAPQLAAQVVGRVQGFDFGAKEGVAPLTILYPIDFLPAT